ncbi:MAG: D-aminoacylase [Acidobacteria bacterium]|nr:D-aminoacylase [Acidobacteriota bacterium]
MIRKVFLVSLVFVLSIISLGDERKRPAAEFDLLISHGRIIDGSGNPWFAGDIGIRDGRVAEIGRIESSRATKTIEAKGLVVAPGFIDVHTHIESGILRQPVAENFLRMGVTSVVTGNCGGSELNLDEWFAGLEKNGISLNIASLIGHNTVRRAGMNGDFDRPPTAEEMEKMRGLVEKGMRDGAVGLSTGLIYIPGTFAKTGEIVELAKVVAGLGGVYASHMRNEGLKIEDAIREALEVGQQAGCPVEISHFKVSSKKRWGASGTIIKMVEEARARGLQVTVDQYLYTASSTNLGVRFPSWVFEGGREKSFERLQDPATRARIKKEMIDENQKNGREDFSFSLVANYRPKPEYNGKSITEITRLARGKTGAEEEAEQMIEMILAGGAQMIYHTMTETDLEHIFKQPFTMVASDAGVIDFNSPAVPHPRGAGNNARALGVYVREKRLVGIEEAIRKMTSLPAQTFKLWDRGILRPGMAADLVIFDEQKVIDRASYREPKQYPLGIDYVIVNGEVVVESGAHTGGKPGKALRGRGVQVSAR